MKEKLIKYNYSDKAIRFYSNRTDQKDVLQDINDWWQDLDKKLVTVWHIKEFLFDPHKGNWVTPQQSPKKVQVVNPSLSRISSELVELSFSDENGTVQKIESPCIDIDFEKQCLLLWTTPFELYIFHYD